MAKATTARKKKTVRAVRRGVNRFALAPTNDWFKAKHFVHYEIESKEWGTKIREYIKKNYSRTVVANINKLPDWKVSNYSHWAATAFLLDANPGIVPEGYVTGIKRWVDQLSAEGATVVAEKKAEEAVKKNVYVPTIQERISEQSQEACGAIEEWLEGYLTDPQAFDPRGFDFAGHFAKMKVTQAHARKIKKYYEGWLEEARAVVDMPTPAQISKIKDPAKAEAAQQLREGYSHVKKANAKKWLEALETLMGACDMVIGASKATRKPRMKKAPSKEKMVARLKIKERDDKLQIVSVNPLELIESTEVWVYNTKTRKLGRYVAEEGQVIQVKGTGLQFYDADRSVQKTLRKPEETLKEFKRAGKVKLRKFLSEINAVEIKLNGRLNADTVILRVDK